LLSPHGHTARRNPAHDLELEQFESTRGCIQHSLLLVVMQRESNSWEMSGRAGLNTPARAPRSRPMRGAARK
jgi:hypothetical protein